MQFEFATATRIVFGPGTLKESGPIIAALGTRPLVVTGRNVGRAEPILFALRQHNVAVSTFSVSEEPTIATISAGIAAAKEHRADCIVGFGGGSALDAGKAIAILLTNPGEVLDYLEVIGRGKSLSQPSLPFVAIPTTSGTGAEVTRNAVIGSPEHRAKASLRSPHMLPRVAIVDPDLTVSLPPDVTATSGMDALTQLIEPFVCSRANPMTDALCRHAIPLAALSLRVAVADGASKTAREEMALASLFGGLALSNAGLGAVHGFANPIGGMFPAPHGAICAALLPHVMRANVRALRDERNEAKESRYEEIARMVTGKPTATAEDGVQWIATLVNEIQIPPLRRYGIKESDVDEIVFKSQKASSMKANPVLLTADALKAVLLNAL